MNFHLDLAFTELPIFRAPLPPQARRARRLRASRFDRILRADDSHRDVVAAARIG